jgi:Superinfection immunity protein
MTRLKEFVTVIGCLLFALLLIVGFKTNNLEGALVLIFGIAASFAIYFLPTIIAMARSHPATVPLFLLNLFLGWTLLGWVAALVWSAMPIKQERQLTLMERELIERRIANEL